MSQEIEVAKISPLARNISVIALTVSLTACGGTTDTATQNQSSSATKTAATSTGKLDLGGNLTINGAGASFPAPLYQRWFADLNKKYPNLQVNYQSVGSGAGVKQFKAGTVDFGASDVAMKDKDIAEIDANKGVLLLPMSAGSVVFAYNLPGVNDIKLSREVYIDILLGKIKKWNDPKLTAINSGVNLPDKNITFVHRSDGSGTTGVFTKHLSAISKEWESKVGEGKTVQWPTGVGAKGNEGVTAQIKQTEGSIGYIEYGYAKLNNISFATLENKEGEFVKPSDEAASKTLSAVTLPSNLRAFIKDPEGKESYPIVTYTWILAYQKYDNPAKAKAVEAMIEYGLTEGQKVSTELGYVPLPENVIKKVAAAADTIAPDYTISVANK
ncbi:phosphate ABC transporter substrate-binding protein PstS [Calothrix rhizosoleniae]|uniref:phosphate ABC transporter substrate-binding protein PstS n=1 Tax=Calothrix rhizosoleniae TaxID=888997 RepID=UPI000B499451|nr:phosphate ABC transporter substrate-binding protein PstS [Calothrix rhizosoleniae]